MPSSNGSGPGADWRAVRRRLREADFEGLFVEELGWDPLPRVMRPVEVVVGARGAEEPASFELSPVAEKRGFVAYRCPPGPDGGIPPRPARDAIDRRVAKDAYEHLVVYTDADAREQVWQWARREPGRPAARREHRLAEGADGEALGRRISGLSVSLKEEEDLTIVEVSGRVRAAFDVEPVTKRFFRRFQQEHGAFLSFIQGISDQGDREWYASIMLNRLMFVYFVQKKGFLDRGDTRYLRNRMEILRERQGADRFLTFYRHFLLRLFHEGFSRERALRNPDLDELIGEVPYLNGGLFEPHELEREYPDLHVPDEAFGRIFDFFDDYNWYLDERPLREGNEINPDVLGYIFEKYINQKQMGAYYTKEDVTGYISENTIIPRLFDAAEEDCAIAFRPDSAMWGLLAEDPNRYIYAAVKKGVVEDGEFVSLPDEIQAGVNDVSKRGGWNRPADDGYALPTETWREHVARRERCEELYLKLGYGDVTSIDDFVTLNLDIRQFAQDAIDNCEGPELLRAFYKAIMNVSVLDPTCGSGAFLFAALNILEPLYEACLERMERFVEEDSSGERYQDFREILVDVGNHPNRRYFVLKSIIVRNLYGVDIMEEAVEIARLRLFLKLMAQLGNADEIEPLPDIDFNLRAGNTLVGFASMEEVRRTLEKKFDFGGSAEKIEDGARAADAAFGRFRRMQMEEAGTIDSKQFAEAKAELRERLGELNAELDQYLAVEYGVEPGDEEEFDAWRDSHRPFHWLVEFYGIMQQGGFGVVVGNPPYVEYSRVRAEYTVINFETEPCSNLYAYVIERCGYLTSAGSRIGMIVQLSAICTDRMERLQEWYTTHSRMLWASNYDDRPAKLFDGLEHIRATILLSLRGRADKPEVFTTNLMRWYTETRSSLFPSIQYGLVSALTVPGSFPKAGDRQLRSILQKVRSVSRSLAAVHDRRSRYVIHYYRSPLYWIRSMNFLPYFSSATASRSVHHFKDFGLTREERMIPGKLYGRRLTQLL